MGRILVKLLDRLGLRVLPPALALVLAIACGGPENIIIGDFPQNVGYLRASSPRDASLTIFDADTFEVHRTVELPDSWVSYSHRLEVDPAGRIWLAYAQDGMDRFVRHSGVLVFSPEGDLEHDLDLNRSQGEMRRNMG